MMNRNTYCFPNPCGFWIYFHYLAVSITLSFGLGMLIDEEKIGFVIGPIGISFWK